jgi:hypothetical protein
LRRAVDLAVTLRAGDFFCADVFAAARATGFLDFLLAMMLSFPFGESSLSRNDGS